ncbi:MAG: LysR family transcriptional regulator [Desulfobacula sp.]|jgi:DNA-binding transcriptional LysR family regulator|nr:LysR family transcriptional regulator [Desulfobacula sp.]MBT6339158.1 LysR family transcriptional regulator [Desulfobacula sp.]MBT7259908.1 LysR family transcriptional regulator [Desulfobacula sp.]
MEISHLRVFQTVAETGSVSSAAHNLNCVQSNVTARIKGLENELGSKLFYRKPRGMIATPAGKILLDYAKQILHLEREAKKALLDDDKIQGQLMLGAFESVAAVRLPIFLSKYHRLYPEVDISLITGTSADLNQKVLNYEIDGAFVTDEYRAANMKWTEAFREELVLIYPPGNESPETAAQKGVLVFPRPCAYRERLELWFQKKGLALNQKMELGSADGMLECVAAGMGVSILPFSLVEKASKLGIIRVHRIGKKIESVPIMFVKREDTLISKSLNAFLELLANQGV